MLKQAELHRALLDRALPKTTAWNDAVVGLAAGGHAKVVMEVIRAEGKYRVVGLVDAREDLQGEDVLGVPVLGGDELLEEIYARGVRRVFIGLGAVQATRFRAALYEKAIDLGFEVVSAIHPAAVVSPSARLGEGLTGMAGAIVGAEAQIGINVIVNTGAIVEHGCTVGDHAHIATGARLAGDVAVGRGAMVGIGACVRQGIKIGCNAIVGAGAVVVKDVPEGVVVAGVPARIFPRMETK